MPEASQGEQLRDLAVKQLLDVESWGLLTPSSLPVVVVAVEVCDAATPAGHLVSSGHQLDQSEVYTLDECEIYAVNKI